MRIISYNTNGIRAAIKKGFLEWLATNPADVICIQETKALQSDVAVSEFEKLGYTSHWFSAQKKGYSGVAIFTKRKPDAVIEGNGFVQSDFEGRVIRADFGELTILNCYFPSGTSGDERQTYKYQWLKEIQQFVEELKKTRKQIVLCGDYNIAHQPIDIHDPKGNKNTSGFLPEERTWLSNFLESGFIDTYRYKNPETVGGYSWWSQRFPSVRLQNKGWRIDYICVSKALEASIKAATIYPDVKHSDHCPIYLELDL
ncbi:MAG: exodeoxyribonuclease III [Chitinophagaceae bacterium]